RTRRGGPRRYRIGALMLDFEQLAFIEKWRQRASRGIVVALDGTRGDILITMRLGEGADHLDMRGRDNTGAVRKSRLTLGDRVTIAIEYRARDAGKASGRGVSGQLVAPGPTVEGAVIRRSGRPTSSLKTPYACETLPCGQ